MTDEIDSIPDSELTAESPELTDDGQVDPIPDENSEVPETKKEEAASNPPEEWRIQLKSFHEVVNGVLAAKESYKLHAIDKKVKEAFAKNWRIESNRHFQLMVNLRRRAESSRVGGKTVA